jgi:hypothetical protein
MKKKGLPPDVALELKTLEKVWNLLQGVSNHAQARILLFVLRKHQNSGFEVDIRALEREAVEPRRNESEGT